VFTARYALSPYIKQIRFVFKGLNEELLQRQMSYFSTEVSLFFSTIPEHIDAFLPSGARLRVPSWLQLGACFLSHSRIAITASLICGNSRVCGPQADKHCHTWRRWPETRDVGTYNRLEPSGNFTYQQFYNWNILHAVYIAFICFLRVSEQTATSAL
jgi:hypothetical protein